MAESTTESIAESEGREGFEPSRRTCSRPAPWHFSQVMPTTEPALAYRFGAGGITSK